MTPSQDLGQLLVVLASCLGTTVGVCAWLLRAQQRERERSETRADARIDRLFEMLDDRIKEQTIATRDLAGAMREFGARLDHLESRTHK